MTDTLMTRTQRAQLAPQWQPAWDMLNGLTGSATFVEVFAQAPQLLEFVMGAFYQKLFHGPGLFAERLERVVDVRDLTCSTCSSSATEATYHEIAVAAGAAPSLRQGLSGIGGNAAQGLPGTHR